jgi:PKD repeat protein
MSNATVSAPAPAAEPPKKSAWYKTALGALAGVLSGAVMMYMSPLLDRVFKPAKPVANFAVDCDGLIVTIHDRSSGGTQGWWDFGDGSPLEPTIPGREVLTHTYAHPGDFTVKLTLRNCIADSDSRTVNIHLDPVKLPSPSIAEFEIIPVSPGSYAPATFKVVSKVKDAQLCVWDLDEDRPLEVTTESLANSQRLVTFSKPGGYVIKMAAVNGSQAVVRSDIAQVNEPPTGAITAVLTVSEQATRVEAVRTSYTFSVAFPPDATDDSYTLDRMVPAKPGYEIVDVRVQTGDGKGPNLNGATELLLDPAIISARGARELRLQLADDRRSIRLVGELVRDTGPGSRNAPLPSVVFPVVLIEERRSPATRPPTPVAATVSAPGAAMMTLPPLPEDWVKPQRDMRIELREGGRVVWQESQLPKSAIISLQNRRCVVTAKPIGEQVRLDLVEVPASIIPSTN